MFVYTSWWLEPFSLVILLQWSRSVGCDRFVHKHKKRTGRSKKPKHKVQVNKQQQSKHKQLDCWFCTLTSMPGSFSPIVKSEFRTICRNECMIGMAMIPYTYYTQSKQHSKQRWWNSASGLFWVCFESMFEAQHCRSFHHVTRCVLNSCMYQVCVYMFRVF